MNTDGRGTRNQLRYGERAVCHRCSMEIEWLGPHGWQGRGADRFCDESGAHPYDFDGCSSGRDCSCCGDRWDAPWKNKGTETPSFYGSQPITPDTKLEEVTQYGGWMTRKGRPEGFIHYRDGRIVPTLLR